jgi:hypothetical protein
MIKSTLVQDRDYTEAPLTRRSFFKSLLITWASVSSLSWQLAAADPVATSDDRPSWLQASTGDPNATSRLGKAYLSTHPEEGDTEVIMRLIDESLDRLPGLEPARLEQPAQVAEALKRLVRTDYIQDDVVSLQGWILSRTEARLYALTAKMHNS